MSEKLRIPDGWRKDSPYSITKSGYWVCRVSVCGVRYWELWRGSIGRDLRRLHCEAHDDGGFSRCIEVAEEMMEAA